MGDYWAVSVAPELGPVAFCSADFFLANPGAVGPAQRGALPGEVLALSVACFARYATAIRQMTI